MSVRRYTMPEFLFDADDGGGGDGGDGDEGRKVPLSQLRDERKKAAAEKQRADELERRLAALEEKDKSELEKAVARAERAEKERDGLKADLDSEKKGRAQDKTRQMIAEAAADAKFHNPSWAARLMDPEVFESIESPEQAKKAVEDLVKADTAGTLVQSGDDGKRGAEKVLQDGKPVKRGEKNDQQDAEPDPGLPRLQAAYAAASAESS